MIRITYKKHPRKNIYFTKNMIAGNKAVYGTIINRDSDGKFQCIVTDLSEGNVIYNQLCETFASSKRVIKNKFKELGVVIYDEVRKKIG